MSKPRYECVATNPELIAAKEEGKEGSVAVKLLVISGPETGVEKYWYGNLNGGAAEFTFQALRIMGWTGKDLSDLSGIGSTRFAAVEDKKMLPAQGNKPPKQVTNYQIWAMEGRPRLDETETKAVASRFKALAASIPPVAVTEGNKAPDVLPAVRTSNGSNGSAPVEGPALSGTQF